MTQVFINDWSESKLAGLLSDFRIKEEDINGEILFASYTYEDYSGAATVIFRRGETLYEVHGSHCSCYGLEDQWEPEETTIEALRKQCEPSSWDYDSDKEHKAALKALLDALEA